MCTLSRYDQRVTQKNYKLSWGGVAVESLLFRCLSLRRAHHLSFVAIGRTAAELSA
jgi:hypothetical protein